MNDVIEVTDKEQLAKRQNSRDLQVGYDAGDVETQFMEMSDGADDSFAFFRIQREK
jgi:hypothetical protein